MTRADSARIAYVGALEVIDSRGNPTIRATVTLESGHTASATVPSGASTGEGEACEVRDGDPQRYYGLGVRKALGAIEGPLRQALVGMSVEDQNIIDQRLIEADGTQNKSHLGANALLSLSLAVAHARAAHEGRSLYSSLSQQHGGPISLPCPMLNIINGGMHAANNLEIQEFMIRPHGAPTFSEAMRWSCEIYACLRNILRRRGHPTTVGDEGGFAPFLRKETEALDLLIEAVEGAGLKPGLQVSFALDCAASSLYNPEDEIYEERKKKLNNEVYQTYSSEEYVDFIENLVDQYPIDSVEDALAEEDWEGWKVLSKRLGHRVQIVGDDLFVTNPLFLQRGIDNGIANAILIKPNQIGTLTETFETIALAKENGYRIILSHRSGETCDTTISDIAVAADAGQIKAGSVCRSERVSKYNRLLYIESSEGMHLFRDHNPFSIVE